MNYAIALKHEVDRTYPLGVSQFDDMNPRRVHVWQYSGGLWVVSYKGRLVYPKAVNFRPNLAPFEEAIKFAQSYARSTLISELLD